MTADKAAMRLERAEVPDPTFDAVAEAETPDAASPAFAEAEVRGTASAAVTEDDLALFVGKNADRYLDKFRKFQSGRRDAFAVTWHWPAFLFPFWWMLYRKMYLWAVASVFLVFIPFVGLITRFVFGISGNYLYYQHARKKVQEMKAGPGTDEDRAAAITRAGDVNRVLLVIAPIAIVVMVAVLAAIAIPQFAMYRQKAFDTLAKREVQDACARGTGLFSARPELAQLEPEDLLNAGLMRSPEIEMMLLDGRRDSFSLSAKHFKGGTTYYTDRACVLREKR